MSEKKSQVKDSLDMFLSGIKDKDVELSANLKIHPKLDFEDVGIENSKTVKVLSAPYVVENGTAILAPDGFFESDLSTEKLNGWVLYRLGTLYKELVIILEEISTRHNYRIGGFHNSSAELIQARTGLDNRSVALAMNRQFSIPLFYDQKAQKILEKG